LKLTSKTLSLRSLRCTRMRKKRPHSAPRSLRCKRQSRDWKRKPSRLKMNQRLLRNLQLLNLPRRLLKPSKTLSISRKNKLRML
jgi:hypothetical protein